MADKSIKTVPTEHISVTILGSALQQAAYTGQKFPYDVLTTLNSHYGIFPDKLPTKLPSIRYFGVGIGGCRNVDDANLQEPHGVKKTNMNLYNPIPIRCVPVEEDLTPAERQSYRLRVRKTINGKDYWCYYLKLISFMSDTIRITVTNPENGQEEDYVFDYSNLTPKPPATNTTTGLITDTSSEVNITVPASCFVTGSEVVEYIAAMYGDMRYAKISELGIFSGEDATVQGEAFNGPGFNYTDAVFTQLNIHKTWNGVDMSNPTAFMRANVRISNSNVVMIS